MRKGSRHTEESKAKVSAANIGRSHTEEAKSNMSKAQKGKTLSAEHKQKLSDGQVGKPRKKHTTEAKERMSRNARGWMAVAKGRSKWYEIQMPDGNVQKVQGTYELRYAQHLLSKDISFTCQPSPHLKYIDQFGGTRTYRPDFWVPSLESYVEIKSTYTLGLRGARKKLEMVQKAGHPLIILTEVELSEMGIDMKSKIE